MGATWAGGYRVGGLGYRVGRSGCRVGDVVYRVGRLGRPHSLPEWRGGAAAGARRSAQAAGSEVHFVCGCELASRLLAKPIQMSFAGSGIPPQSQPARAPHCALVGGYVRRESHSSVVGGLSGRFSDSAPLHGSLRRPLLVPFHTSPLSRGALRSAGVPTIAASTTPAPLQPEHLARALHGIWEDSAGVREYPMCAEGWAMWVLGGSPDLFKATGGTCRLGTP